MKKKNIPLMTDKQRKEFLRLSIEQIKMTNPKWWQELKKKIVNKNQGE